MLHFRRTRFTRISSRRRGAYLEAGVGLPVGRVDLADAADEQLELALVERPQQVGRHQFVEALLQRQKLLLDAAHEPVRHVQPATPETKQ